MLKIIVKLISGKCWLYGMGGKINIRISILENWRWHSILKKLIFIIIYTLKYTSYEYYFDLIPSAMDMYNILYIILFLILLHIYLYSYVHV